MEQYVPDRSQYFCSKFEMLTHRVVKNVVPRHNLGGELLLIYFLVHLLVLTGLTFDEFANTSAV